MRVGPPQIEKLPIIIKKDPRIENIASKVDYINEILRKINRESRFFLKWISNA